MKFSFVSQVEAPSHLYIFKGRGMSTTEASSAVELRFHFGQFARFAVPRITLWQPPPCKECGTVDVKQPSEVPAWLLCPGFHQFRRAEAGTRGWVSAPVLPRAAKSVAGDGHQGAARHSLPAARRRRRGPRAELVVAR